MVKIVPTHPHLVAEHQDTILSSVDDDDISIRMRALDLLSALVSRLTFLLALKFISHRLIETIYNQLCSRCYRIL